MSLPSSKAIEIVTSTNSYFNTSNNISSATSNWSTGWGAGNTNTGWNYVGQVSDASGIYLGNGWVITAAHVNSPNSFTLAGNTYNATGLSYTDFTNSSTGTTNADIHLFQIFTTSTNGFTLSLPTIPIATTAPSAFSLFNSGSQIVMIGYGGGSESWGINTVTTAPYPAPILLNGYATIDFETAHGTTTFFTKSITNDAELVNGDSGGADFMTNASGTWQVAGLNEAVDTNGDAFLIQLSSYYSQINPLISAVPEPGTCGLLGISGIIALFAIGSSRRRARSSIKR